MKKIANAINIVLLTTAKAMALVWILGFGSLVYNAVKVKVKNRKK